jgi:hypothetical protein
MRVEKVFYERKSLPFSASCWMKKKWSEEGNKTLCGKKEEGIIPYLCSD